MSHTFQQKEIAVLGQQITAQPSSCCRVVAAGRDERERSSWHWPPAILLGSFSKAASKDILPLLRFHILL